MKKYLQVAKELDSFEKVKACLASGKSLDLTGLVDSSKIHIGESLVASLNKNISIYVTYDEKRAAMLVNDCSFFGAETYYYPGKDPIFYAADLHSDDLVIARLKVIARLIKHLDNPKEAKEKLSIVTTMSALTDYCMPLDAYRKAIIKLQEGLSCDPKDLVANLLIAGYERAPLVEKAGQFAQRGGIIDIFPISEDNPVRIDFWGDDIDTIRAFDPENQRSINNLKEVMVFPATEYLLGQEEAEVAIAKIKADIDLRLEELGDKDKNKSKESYEICNRLRASLTDFQIKKDWGKFFSYFNSSKKGFLDYFPSDTFLCFDEPGRLEESYIELEKQYKESMDYRYENGYILEKQKHNFKDLKSIIKTAKEKIFLTLSTIELPAKSFRGDEKFHIETSGINAYNNSFKDLVKDLKRYKKLKYRVILVTASHSRRDRLAQDLRAEDLESFVGKDEDSQIDSGLILVCQGTLSRSFAYPSIRYVVIAESDIYNNKTSKRAKRKTGPSIEELKLVSGDYVVHESYGIGIYRGIVKQKVDNSERDYIQIDYAGNSRIFILASQTDRLQKYASSEVDKAPRINKLGTKAWEATKHKTQTAVELIAADLVKLYAKRNSVSGFRFDPDNEWQKEFEELFPYDETYDQLEAIAAVKADMESDKVMDRLICGDVGFGKTEVALRAAFKAVASGKQVALLAPTTILASQHFETFVNRFKPFPVTIDYMSGMRTRGENIRVAKDLKAGFVDIVIGTHRILSSDVDFKDLGLVIIDEEQRFGVNHKEKLKKLKAQVDVMALSATPIPRTLSMSLSGIRDMSTLEEAPVDRTPIQTFVAREDKGLIREAIIREISRGGQVYFIYNQIRNIDEVKASLEELVPEATFEVAHGQLDTRAMNDIMTSFINGEIDVLVSTTIVETGLDIPNANTIIIENAEKFGLSQLYQLRGRVGRSFRTAYAFLFYKVDRIISEVAQKRLTALSELTELGSGYKLAMKDLEIRGAGALLGKSQHGHMAAVGFDLYTRMLNDAVAKEKGLEVAEYFETSIDINVDAHLPDDYVQKESQKMDLYKRIATIDNVKDVEDINDELLDRFGPIPKATSNLIDIALIKALAHSCQIAEISGGKKGKTWISRFEFKSYKKLESQESIKEYQAFKDRVYAFTKNYGQDMIASFEGASLLIWKLDMDKVKTDKKYLTTLMTMLKDFKESCKED